MSRSSVVPSCEEVRDCVRTAMYDPDPLSRAEAVAMLIAWDLPAGPEALVLTMRRGAAFNRPVRAVATA
jgi:hypothetical protein